MPQRTAPAKEGYRFGNKAQYRRIIWAEFRRMCRVPLAEAHAALMPSSEGLEIDVAKQNGFREKHLHIIDRNPAIVATLKRRYPYINTYGVDAERAVERMKERGVKLYCANWDFCGPAMTVDNQKLVQTCTDPDLYLNENCVAVTALKGRDDPNVMALMESVWATQNQNFYGQTFDADASGLTARTQFMLTNCLTSATKMGRHSEIAGGCRIGEYKSVAGSPMTYVIVARHRQPCKCSRCQVLQADPLFSVADHLESIMLQASTYRTKRGDMPKMAKLVDKVVAAHGTSKLQEVANRVRDIYAKQA